MRVPRKRIAKLVDFVAAQEGQRVALADIAVVSSAEIAGHNRRFLRHGGATDVISFDLSDNLATGITCQIIVCADLAVRVGPAHGHSPTQELLLYIIHGLLHVMGYDDTDIRAGAKMHGRQDELLASFVAQERSSR